MWCAVVPLAIFPSMEQQKATLSASHPQTPRLPQVVGLLTPETLEFGDPQVQEDLGLCDLLEIRFDLFPKEELWRELAAEVGRRFPRAKIIATVRLERDGGRFPDRYSEQRMVLYRELAEKGLADWVDIELEEEKTARKLIAEMREQDMRVLLSHHDFAGVPDAAGYEALWARMTELKPDGVKLAVRFGSPQDEGALYDFIQAHAGDLRLRAAFSMGAFGLRSRAVGPLLGAPMTYGYAGRAEAAPGQWPVRRLRSLFAAIAAAGQVEPPLADRRIAFDLVAPWLRKR